MALSEIVVRTLRGDETTLRRSELPELDGAVLDPTSPGYEDARRLWNGMIDKRPALIVRAANALDVQKCVRLAAKHELALAVRGGGHNVAGHAVCDGGLVIDLTEMRSVRVDAKNRLAHIQGGARLGDVDSGTVPFGLATPSGVVSDTGYAGLTLHGGVGWLLRKHGLAADNIAAAEIVSADGQLLRVGPDEHEDLYFAIRGGGGNFGVVTSFTSRVHPIPAHVTLAVPIFALEHAEGALAFARRYVATAPEELMVVSVFWTAPDLPQVPAQHRGAHALFLLSCWTGAPEDADRVLSPLRTCKPTVADLTRSGRFDEIQRFLDEDYPAGRRYYWKSTMVPALDDSVLHMLTRHAESRPSKLSSIDVFFLGGAFARVPADETAFGSRDVRYMINYESNWERAEDDATNIDWTRRSLKEVEALTQSRAYLNIAGFGEEGDALIRASVGKSYEPLAATKAAWDPKNLFRSNFNVPPVPPDAASGRRAPSARRRP